MAWAHPHLLGIADLSAADIVDLLDRAEALVDADAGTLLSGKVVVNAFYENSTRTALSFQLAAKRLGAHDLSMSVAYSSVVKGETLADTARTLDALGADAIVLRHAVSGAAAEVASVVGCAVINAGDGTNEHPTQALIDALALRRRFGNLAGLIVAICGDIRHSRVARSNMLLLTQLGIKVRVTGPPALLPDETPDGVAVMSDMDEAVAGADAVMMLRVQHERMPDRLDLPLDLYHERHGLTEARMRYAAPHAVVMHPGPINRGVEIADALADDPARSVILDQVTLGVPVRMACLAALVA